MACGTEGCCPDAVCPETFLIGARVLESSSTIHLWTLLFVPDTSLSLPALRLGIVWLFPDSWTLWIGLQVSRILANNHLPQVFGVWQPILLAVFFTSTISLF
jgi:hypothetical protein